MLWLLLLLAALSWLVSLRWKGRKVRNAMKQMKTDFLRLPLLGDLYHFMGDNEKLMSTFHKLGRQAIKYGGWTSIHLGLNNYFAMVADPLEADYVMKTHLEKNDVVFKLAKGLLGNGLLFAPVSIWRPRRKQMTPVFKQRNLEQFVDVFYQKGSIMAERLQDVADGRTFSIWDYFTLYALSAVFQTIFDVDLDYENVSDQGFRHNFREFTLKITKPFLYPWLRNGFVFKCYCYFQGYSPIQTNVEVMKAFLKSKIENKQKELKGNLEIYSPNNDEEKEKKIKTILELLIESLDGGKGYTNLELQEDMSVLIIAGTDTSATGGGFVCMMLANNQDGQDKVYKEIQDVFGDSDRPITAEDLPKLKYLELFIKETLRLYPPATIIGRKVNKKEVSPAGIQMVPGMDIIINIWAIHRHPDYWGEDAEEFRPERFYDSPPSHPAAYIPFAAGSRSCVGYKFAMMSMMTVIATLLRHYKILPRNQEDTKKPLRTSLDVMTKHVHDFQLKLEPRR